jgi:hypothetical protein
MDFNNQDTNENHAAYTDSMIHLLNAMNRMGHTETKAEPVDIVEPQYIQHNMPEPDIIPDFYDGPVPGPDLNDLINQSVQPLSICVPPQEFYPTYMPQDYPQLYPHPQIDFSQLQYGHHIAAPNVQPQIIVLNYQTQQNWIAANQIVMEQTQPLSQPPLYQYHEVAPSPRSYNVSSPKGVSKKRRHARPISVDSKRIAIEPPTERGQEFIQFYPRTNHVQARPLAPEVQQEFESPVPIQSPVDLTSFSPPLIAPTSPMNVTPTPPSTPTSLPDDNTRQEHDYWATHFDYKYLVCKGGIKRKNKRTEPEDSYQLRWKMR